MSHTTSPLAGLGPDDGSQRAQVLVVGSGGREHALAWKLAQSSHVARVYVAPGNGGTQQRHAYDRVHNVDVAVDDHVGLLAFAHGADIALTIVGPEAPLAAGLVDRFIADGLVCFGPRRVSAQLEASKAFAKAFMLRHGIPTAHSRLFDALAPAQAYVRELNGPCVVKASGLAAGKGVVVCDGPSDALAALERIMADRAFGEAGASVLVEERLIGEEASVLAFCDGRIAVPMPAAQDHKRLLSGSRGPNTGGMGAYAPAPVITPELSAFVQHEVFDRVMAGMAAEAYPYVGILYAGLMITDDGPRVLEFNCRFGDPETQVLLPLLDSDLFEVLQACVSSDLAPGRVRWKSGAAATVVAASGGYPQAYTRGHTIGGIELAAHARDTFVFHAGTRRSDEQWLTDGGRVLAVTGVGADLRTALNRAYAGVHRIGFEGMHARDDIGWRALARLPAMLPAVVANANARPHLSTASPTSVSYKDAGVDLAAGAKAIALMKDAVEATHGPAVLSAVGAFGGLFDTAAFSDLTAPVLVASTDGVGTKTKVATALGRVDGLGYDIVNHSINDILVQGARPLFFLDYIASSVLDPEQVARVVGSCAAACKAAGCALLGGETAEMPGVYVPGELDLVGTIVGVVARDQVIDGSRICPGDVVFGLASAGLHTNGFSLARKVLIDQDFNAPRSDLGGVSIGDALLAPHVSYLAEVAALRAASVDIKGLAHITGGGLIDNPPRILPENTALELVLGSWDELPIFTLIRDLGRIAEREMANVFNLGVGMLVVVPGAQADATAAALRAHAASGGARSWRVGDIIARDDGASVRFVAAADR